MKRLFLAFSALALMTACSQDELVEEAQPTSYDLTVTATMPEADTRTYVNGTAVYWEEGDKITIVSKDNQYSAELTMDYEGGTTTQFSGKVTFDPSLLADGTAYYTPGSDNINFSYTAGTEPTYGLKSSATYDYFYSADSQFMSNYSPMAGEFKYNDGKGSVTFQHTAALMRIVLKGVPENTSGTLKLVGKVSSTGSSLPPAGLVAASYEWNVSFRNNDNNSSADDMAFDIPIPAATARTYEATIKEGEDDNSATGWKAIGSYTTSATSPTAGQMVVMDEVDYGTLFTYDLTVNAGTTAYSDPQSEES